jgi:hypothetical protein
MINRRDRKFRPARWVDELFPGMVGAEFQSNSVSEIAVILPMRRAVAVIAKHQFSLGRWTESITRTSSCTLADSSFKPSWSCRSVKREDMPGSDARVGPLVAG